MQGLQGLITLLTAAPPAEGGGTSTGMQALIDAVTSFMSSLMTWFNSIAENIVTQPIMLLFVVVLPVASIVWGLVMSIIKRGKRKRG